MQAQQAQAGRDRYSATQLGKGLCPADPRTQQKVGGQESGFRERIAYPIGGRCPHYDWGILCPRARAFPSAAGTSQRSVLKEEPGHLKY